MSDQPWWLALILGLAGGGGGFWTFMGARDLVRQRKNERAKEEDDGRRADREKVDELIADAIQRLQQELTAVGIVADRAKDEVRSLWEVIHEYRLRDLRWIELHAADSAALLAAGGTPTPMPDELKKGVPLPGSTARPTAEPAT